MDYLRDVCCRQRENNSANVQVSLHFREKARRFLYGCRMIKGLIGGDKIEGVTRGKIVQDL